jgi:hypothetical protein
MKQYSAILAAALLLCSAGLASAQSRNYDSSGAPKFRDHRSVAAAGWSTTPRLAQATRRPT